MPSEEFHLSGKDYLTEKEAAHYCCVSVSQLRAKGPEIGIVPFRRFLGKNIYRRADLAHAIERAAPQIRVPK